MTNQNSLVRNPTPPNPTQKQVNSQCIRHPAQLVLSELGQQRHSLQDAEAHVVLQDRLDRAKKLEKAAPI